VRRITIVKWKATPPNGKEITESTVLLIQTLISGTKPADMPRGLEQFRLFKRLDEAFTKAEKTDTLELEEDEYAFVTRLIEQGIPAIWATNKDISKAVDKILTAEEIK